MGVIIYFGFFIFLIYVCLKKSNAPIVKEKNLSTDTKNVLTNNQNIEYTSCLEPVYFDDFIGNDNVKESLRTAIKIIQQLKTVHIIFTGWAGCGKTRLTEIVANELNAHYIYTIPEQLKDYNSIMNVINQIQETDNLTVWCVDEIHNIDKGLINLLLPILQNNRLGNVSIKPFVFIGATTDYDKVYKKSEALVSRFQYKLVLEKYSVEHLVQIIKNYHIELCAKKKLEEVDYKLLAENSRGIPREAINLLLKRLVLNDTEEVLQQSNIIKNSITSTDVRILQTLRNNDKPIGINALAQMAGVTTSDLETVHERYLMEKQYITRNARGRSIAEKGRQFLESLKLDCEVNQNDKTITAYTF